MIIVLMIMVSTWLLKATCRSSPWLPRMKVGQLWRLWNFLDADETCRHGEGEPEFYDGDGDGDRMKIA